MQLNDVPRLSRRQTPHLLHILRLFALVPILSREVMSTTPSFFEGAAHMILHNDNFVMIVVAVKEERTIYANIQKFASFFLGTKKK